MIQTLEQKIASIIEDTIKDLGFELVKVAMQGSTAKVLEILIDRIDGGNISIGDCRLVIRNISALLDVEDVIKSKYILQVSSAGIERPLINFQDYDRFTGRDIKVKLKELLNNCGHYQGKIVKAENNIVVLQVKEGQISIPFSLIKSGHLI